mgnify:CR=1 FL=1
MNLGQDDIGKPSPGDPIDKFRSGRKAEVVMNNRRIEAFNRLLELRGGMSDFPTRNEIAKRLSVIEDLLFLMHMGE